MLEIIEFSDNYYYEITSSKNYKFHESNFDANDKIARKRKMIKQWESIKDRIDRNIEITNPYKFNDNIVQKIIKLN